MQVTDGFVRYMYLYLAIFEHVDIRQEVKKLIAIVGT